MQKTTIQISENTLNRLKSIKNMERQSYDELLNNLIDNQEENVLSESEIDEIKISLENVSRGKIKSIERVATELGVKLT